MSDLEKDTYAALRARLRELHALSQEMLQRWNEHHMRTSTGEQSQGNLTSASDAASSETTAATLAGLRSKGLALVMHMRSMLGKQLEQRLKLEEQIGAKLATVDKLNLQLQSSLYEKTSLLRKIAECNSIDVESAVELLSLEEYVERTGDRLGKAGASQDSAEGAAEMSISSSDTASGTKTKDDNVVATAQVKHEFLVRRLQYELKERKALQEQVERLRMHRDDLAAAVKDRELTLTRVKTRLETLVSAGESYQSELDSASSHVQQPLPSTTLNVSALPKALRVDSTVTVSTGSESVNGEVEAETPGSTTALTPASIAHSEGAALREQSIDPRITQLPLPLHLLYALVVGSLRVSTQLQRNLSVWIVDTPTSLEVLGTSHGDNEKTTDPHVRDYFAELTDLQRENLASLERRARNLHPLSLALVHNSRSTLLHTTRALPAVLISFSTPLKLATCRLAYVAPSQVSRSTRSSGDFGGTDSSAPERPEGTSSMGIPSHESDGEGASLQSSITSIQYHVVKVMDAAPLLSSLAHKSCYNQSADGGYSLPCPLLEGEGLIDAESHESNARVVRAITERILPPVLVGRAFEWLQRLARTLTAEEYTSAATLGSKRSRSAHHHQQGPVPPLALSTVLVELQSKLGTVPEYSTDGNEVNLPSEGETTSL